MQINIFMKIIFSPLAESELKRLWKKYNNLFSDLDNLIKEIKKGNTVVADRLQGFSIPIYKTRIRNSSSNKGKSWGFRIIYHLKINDTFYILALYSKNEMGNIDKKDIIQSLKSLEL